MNIFSGQSDRPVMKNYVVIISEEIFLVVVSDSCYLQNCTFFEKLHFFLQKLHFFRHFDDFLNKDSETTRKLWNAAWTGGPIPRECASFCCREFLSSSSYFEQSNRQNRDFRKTALFSKTALFFKNLLLHFFSDFLVHLEGPCDQHACWLIAVVSARVHSYSEYLISGHSAISPGKSCSWRIFEDVQF